MLFDIFRQLRRGQCLLIARRDQQVARFDGDDRVEPSAARDLLFHAVEVSDGVIIYSLYGEKKDRVVLVRQYRYAIGGYIYEFPAGLVESNEEFHEGAVREMYEETGLKFTPLKVDPAFEKPYFTTVGMTDESCATVYGYAEGEISKDAQEDTEEIEVVLADREEVKRILREENVAIMCAYQLMHFLQDEEPFAFLKEEL